MDVAHLLRTARRHTGMSQRAFAAAAALVPATLASWESGRRSPAAHLLEDALQRVGLELTVAPASDEEPDPALVRHLRRPLTARLRDAVSDEAWLELTLLGQVAHVELAEPLAAALWVPSRPVDAVPVLVRPGCRPLPDTVAVRVTVVDNPPPPYLVPILLGAGRRVWVPPPAVLAMSRGQALRQADLLLHEERGRDDAGRRPPAHRDPDERDEARRVLQTLGITRLVAAPRAPGRAWRTAAPVSLAQLLGRGGTLPW